MILTSCSFFEKPKTMGGDFCKIVDHKIEPPAKVKAILDPKVVEDNKFMKDILKIDNLQGTCE